MNVVEQSDKSIEYIIYAGILKETVREYCHKNSNAMVWDENLCCKCFSSESDNHSINVPVVGIKGDGRDVIMLLRLLREEFGKNDYDAKTLSTISHSYLYGIDYIPQNKHFNDIFESAEKFYCCDLILIGISKDRPNEDAYFDYVINLEDSTDENSRLYASDKTGAAGLIFNNIKAFFDG